MPKSYDDLLQPFWKDKISMDTESFDWFETQLDTRGKEKGLEFMKRLKAQNPILRRGRTAQLELLATGEFPVLLEAYSHRAEKMKEKGSPVEWIWSSAAGTNVTPGGALIRYFNHAPLRFPGS